MEAEIQSPDMLITAPEGENYTRMLLDFMHDLTKQHHRAVSFVFDPQLTNIARQLQKRDIDEALVAGPGKIAHSRNESITAW